MNRKEALRILGLDDDATGDDIKAAYKETAQILHPDRFAGNKKLQDRATEQFKNLQEAYEFLTSGKGARGTSARSGRAGASSDGGGSSARAAYTEEAGFRRGSPASPPPRPSWSPNATWCTTSAATAPSWPASAPWWPFCAAASWASWAFWPQQA